MTTTFQKNARLNLAFGNEAGDPKKFKDNLDRVRNQAKLIVEETKELIEALYFDKDVELKFELKDKDTSGGALIVDINDILKNVLDAQGDITTVNDGLAHIVGVDGDEVLQRVYASNLSKFIVSEDEVPAALQYYYDLGFTEGQLEVKGEFPVACIKVVDTCEVGGKEYPKGKFLKNMLRFKEPDFTGLFGDKISLQTTSIVCTTAVEEGKVMFGGNGRICLAPPSLFAHIMTLPSQMLDETIVSTNGRVESHSVVIHITEEALPEVPALWGQWLCNTRVFTSYPATLPPTELTRVD